MVHLVEQAFRELFPGKDFTYIPEIKYSGQFSGYNANISLNPRTNELTARLSKKWLHVSSEIKKGLVQELLARLFREKAHTVNIDLYNNFLRNVSKIAPKTRTDPVLERSFSRVNIRYFGGLLEQPNLALGSGTTKLGHYDFGTDTIVVSRILLENEKLLDFVMYHEMLHKKHQFSNSSGRNLFHNRSFRQDEKKFENAVFLEKELAKLVMKTRRKKAWKLF